MAVAVQEERLLRLIDEVSSVLADLERKFRPSLIVIGGRAYNTTRTYE
jgi:hypothetical protein